MSGGNVDYYGGVNADYVDGPPAYEADFNATSTIATVAVDTQVIDVGADNNEGWQASVSVTDTTEPVPPTVSIAPADEAGSADAWEVPLGDDQDNTLKFTVTRSGNEADGDFADPLTVRLHPPADTAIEGEDYDDAPLIVTIPADSDYKTFTITANGVLNTKVDKELTLCLEADETYRLGTQYVTSGTFSPVGIVVSELSFDATDHAMFNQIIQDGHIDAQGLPDQSATFGSVQWKDSNSDGDANDAGDVDYPIAYTRSGINGQSATAKVTATFATQLPDGVSVTVRANGPTLTNGVHLRFAAATGTAQGGKIVVTLTTDHALPSVIDKENFALDWEVSLDGDQTWASAGKTHNPLYISNVDLTQPVVETVLDIGCRNALGGWQGLYPSLGLAAWDGQGLGTSLATHASTDAAFF